PTGPVVVEVVVLLTVVLARRLPLLATDDRIVVDKLPEVDPGLVHLDTVGTVRILQIADPDQRIATVTVGRLDRTVDHVRCRGAQNVAMGVYHVPVHLAGP